MITADSIQQAFEAVLGICEAVVCVFLIVFIVLITKELLFK